LASAIYRYTPDLAYLCWDTEDGRRLDENLLRPGTRAKAETDRGRALALSAEEDGVALSFKLKAPVGTRGALTFPFNPLITPVTAFPGGASRDRFPILISAPDFGQLVMGGTGFRDLSFRLIGDRAEKIDDLVIEFETEKDGAQLTCKPFHLSCPEGVDDALWHRCRRGWFGALQLTSEWAYETGPMRSPSSLLGNNVISDPAASPLWFYADQAFWFPRPAPGIDFMPVVQRTTEYWLKEKMKSNGEIICYWDKAGFLDANAGPVIAAWDYVEVTGDLHWLEGIIDRLEKAVDFLVGRDINDDGIIEAIQPGTPGSLIEPARSCAWWDAINCGHQDAFTNAIIYRAFCCMADLEKQLGRHGKQRTYTDRAVRLHAAYCRTFFNSQTGCLMWWRDADGGIHDFWSPTTNGLAIDYGLVPDRAAREIVDVIERKIEEVGFTRFDLGVPPLLVPLPRGDNLLGQSWVEPLREDGSDKFQRYMNGGITAGQVLHYMNALDRVGLQERAEALFMAMLTRQAKGLFQNGVTDEAGKGMDWTDWEGNPCGYEGYLADSWRFMQFVFLRRPEQRARLYRPMLKLSHRP
jgi:hypothetical protein